ncbi:uncharacterized protein LOC117094167 [Trachypithecus francoisi]|uniref:uncharacterized protein LOC117094167 n=1 Tax=Trachypithecus francoisi TaxID=54180 RepID=UPI00141B9910|nr:uncharacterized protein LOC117094167 [Trachypithecus francoisi]
METRSQRKEEWVGHAKVKSLHNSRETLPSGGKGPGVAFFEAGVHSLPPELWPAGPRNLPVAHQRASWQSCHSRHGIQAGSSDRSTAWPLLTLPGFTPASSSQSAEDLPPHPAQPCLLPESTPICGASTKEPMNQLPPKLHSAAPCSSNYLLMNNNLKMFLLSQTRPSMPILLSQVSEDRKTLGEGVLLSQGMSLILLSMVCSY